MLPTREALRATTPPGYRWSVHVGTIVGFTLAGLAVCRARLGPLGDEDAGWIVGSLLATNLGEYLAHRWQLRDPALRPAVRHHPSRTARRRRRTRLTCRCASS